ncbi:MAG: response regulator transcription factor [Actinomycetes bacterium]
MNGADRTRLLLVEDEAMSRAFLTDLLRSDGYVVEAHSTAMSASKSFAAFKPAIIVTDIDLRDGPSGIDLVVALKKRDPNLRVAILSNYAIAPDRRHAALVDAAYLSKRDLNDPSVLLSMLRALLNDSHSRAMDPQTAAGLLASLTPSQAEVLRMVAAGLTNEEIAARRSTSVKSVESIIHRIMAVLGVAQDRSINTRVIAARLFISEAGQPSSPGVRPSESRG